MPLDIDRLFQAVTRSAARVPDTSAPTFSVTLSRGFACPPGALWQALATKEGLEAWFLPVEGELRVGGRYQFKGNAGGEVLTCTPPSLIEATWVMGEGNSTVRLEIAANQGAHLTLIHTAEVDAEFWTTYGPGAVGIGWDVALVGLDAHLGGKGAEMTPEELMLWQSSDEARAFYMLSGADWAQVSTDCFDTPEDAQAAARRSVAFYSGTEG